MSYSGVSLSSTDALSAYGTPTYGCTHSRGAKPKPLEAPLRRYPSLVNAKIAPNPIALYLVWYEYVVGMLTDTWGIEYRYRRNRSLTCMTSKHDHIHLAYLAAEKPAAPTVKKIPAQAIIPRLMLAFMNVSIA